MTMKRILGLAAALALAPVAAFAEDDGGTGKIIRSAASNNSQMVYPAGSWVLTEITVLTTGATAAAFLRLYDTAVAPTCTSATGVTKNYPINAASATYAGFTIAVSQRFTQGIGICLTAVNSDTDNTPATTGINLNFTARAH